MRTAKRIIAGLVLIVVAAAGTTSHGEAVQWQPTLDAAKRTAARTNRLVLVHFWADWCRPCVEMERTVFNRSDVAELIEANFVPVKINHDQFPYTAQQFGVQSIPCDVILTPQGQVIQKATGGAPAEVYKTRLARIAASYRGQRARPAGPPAERYAASDPGSQPTAYGGASANGAAPPQAPPQMPGAYTSAPAVANPQPSVPSPWDALPAAAGSRRASSDGTDYGQWGLVGPRYAQQMNSAEENRPSSQLPGYSQGSGGLPPSSAVADRWWPASGQSPNAASASYASAACQYGGIEPPTGRMAGTAESWPSPFRGGYGGYEPPAAQNPAGRRWDDGVSDRPEPGPAQGNSLPETELSRNAEPASPSLNVDIGLPTGFSGDLASSSPAGQGSGAPNSPQPGDQRDAVASRTQRRGGAMSAGNRIPEGRQLDVPRGNPPLAMEGYCPVSLTENGRWVLGNRRWGVRHEGRTYLFAGPAEQQKFLDDPERYAPVLAGHDLVRAVEAGQFEEGRREYGAWYRDRVYLFANEESFQKFRSDPQRYLEALPQVERVVRRGEEFSGAQGANPNPGRPQQSAWYTPPALQYR